MPVQYGTACSGRNCHPQSSHNRFVPCASTATWNTTKFLRRQESPHYTTFLTFRSHPKSKIFSPFESQYVTSYLTSIDTFSLSQTVFEIFDFKVFRVWPWRLTFRGHLRLKIFSPFESLYLTSYLTSIDISSLSRTVFEIFDIKVGRVWPWPLTLRGHLRSEIFSPFESPCMISYLTSIDTFSPSQTVFEVFDSTSKFLGFDLDLWPL